MNNKTQEKAKRILDEYFAGTLPVALEAKIQSWLAGSENREEKDRALEKLWNEYIRYDETPGQYAIDSLDDITALLGFSPVQTKQTDKIRLGGKRTMLLRVAAIVIPFVLLAGVAGLWIYGNREPVWITTVADAGEQKQFLLPDGSEVWLNPNSQLSFPEKFKTREVKLKGEAFFSVAKNEKAPFIVSAGDLQVSVLGTRFMVTAPTDKDRSTVTLHSGSVEVEVGESQTKLEPGEQLQYYHDDNAVRVEEVVLEDWTKPSLDFYAASLEEIFYSLEKNFGVNFVVDKPLPDQPRYTIRFTAEQNIDDILYILSNLTKTFKCFPGDNDTIEITLRDL